MSAERPSAVPAADVARAALERGDRGLAVQWVMAAKLGMSPALRDWLGDHPDAVVAALHDCCF